MLTRGPPSHVPDILDASTGVFCRSTTLLPHCPPADLWLLYRGLVDHPFQLFNIDSSKFRSHQQLIDRS